MGGGSDACGGRRRRGEGGAKGRDSRWRVRRVGDRRPRRTATGGPCVSSAPHSLSSRTPVPTATQGGPKAPLPSTDPGPGHRGAASGLPKTNVRKDVILPRVSGSLPFPERILVCRRVSGMTRPLPHRAGPGARGRRRLRKTPDYYSQGPGQTSRRVESRAGPLPRLRGSSRGRDPSRTGAPGAGAGGPWSGRGVANNLSSAPDRRSAEKGRLIVKYFSQSNSLRRKLINSCLTTGLSLL